MPNTRDIQLYDRFFALFKGEPGLGKSIAAHSFVDWPPTNGREGTYTFDFDFKMKPIYNYWKNVLHEERYFEYDNFTSLAPVFVKLEDLKRHCPYRTLIWDSVTSFADLTLDQQIEFRDPKKAKVVVAGGSIELNQIEDYGGEARAITRAHNTLKQISVEQNVNVIVVAHVLKSKTTNLKGITNESRVILTGGNKIAVKIPKDFDEMWHFDIDIDYENQRPKYIARTRHTGDDSARTSLPLDHKIEWTDQSLCRIIMKELNVTRI
jgi:AAA domain